MIENKSLYTAYYQVAVAGYILGALCLVWPWLAFQFLFSSDEYVHVYNACVLDKLLGASDTSYSSWFEINSFPEPNWFGHGLLLLAGKILPYWLVEKAFVILLVALNGYAFLSRRSLSVQESVPTGLSRNSILRSCLALLALVCWFGATWQQGFVNYIIGMAAVLAAIVHTAPGEKSATVSIFCWAIFLYFCHPIALLFFIGIVSLRALLNTGLIPCCNTRKTSTWASFIKQWIAWFGVPFALFVAYLFKQGSNSTLEGASPRRMLELFSLHTEIALFNPSEQLIALGLFVLINLSIGAIIVKNLLPLSKTKLLLLTGGLVLLSAIVLAPNYMAGGAFIHQRLYPVFFIWLLWTAAHLMREELNFQFQLGYLVLIAALCVGLSMQRLPVLAKADKLLKELLVFGQEIKVGSVVLPVGASGWSLGHEVSLSLKPILHHYAGVLGCERDLVLLDNYEAFVGYFPLTWKPGLDPFRVFTNEIEAHPANLLASGKQWFQLNVDYVLAIGSVEESVTPETLSWMQSVITEVDSSAGGTYKLYQVQPAAPLLLKDLPNRQ